jgi:heme ABC exporter ATP-binding subunit CcmA
MTGAGAAVRLDGVSRLFGTVAALRRVSLTVGTGESVVLHGPNGSGKTTLLNVLATVLTPTFGTGRVLGHDLVTGRSRIRPGIELLGHHARLYDELSAAENLRLTCRLYRSDATGVPAALDRVGLAGAAGQRVGGFSPGMRQRVALARLLLRAPALLLLDEPYAAVDEATKSLVDELLRAARDAGRTVIVSTHDGGRMHWADRIVTLRSGSVAAPDRSRR